ncbi:hypothetical protein D9M68_802150 [compost metagenome]
MNAARHLQVGRRRAAQGRQPAAGRIGKRRRLQSPQLPGPEPSPELARKRVQGGQPHLERQDARRARPGEFVAHGRGGRLRGRRGSLRLQVGRHHRAGLPARLDIALGGEQRIRDFDRAPRHAQFLGQRPRGRNAVARLEGAVGDGAAESLIDLAVQGVGAAGRRDLGNRLDHGIVKNSFYGPSNYGMRCLPWLP